LLHWYQSLLISLWTQALSETLRFSVSEWQSEPCEPDGGKYVLCEQGMPSFLRSCHVPASHTQSIPSDLLWTHGVVGDRVA